MHVLQRRNQFGRALARHTAFGGDAEVSSIFARRRDALRSMLPTR